MDMLQASISILILHSHDPAHCLFLLQAVSFASGTVSSLNSLPSSGCSFQFPLLVLLLSPKMLPCSRVPLSATGSLSFYVFCEWTLPNLWLLYFLYLYNFQIQSFVPACLPSPWLTAFCVHVCVSQDQHGYSHWHHHPFLSLSRVCPGWRVEVRYGSSCHL